MRRSLRLAAILAAATIGFASSNNNPSAAASWKRVKVPHLGALLLNVPENWRLEAIQPPTMPLRIDLGPASASGLPVSIDILPDRPSDPKNFRMSAEMGRDLKPAVGKKGPVLELQGDRTLGYYWTYAPRDTGPSGAKYLTEGSVVVEDLVLPFRIRSDDPADPLIATALEILRTVRKEAVTQEERLANPRPHFARMMLPSRAWVLALDLPGFRNVLDEVRLDGSAATLQAENSDTRITLTASVEIVARLDGAGACKEALWKRAEAGSTPRSEIREMTSGDAIEVHYVVGEENRQNHVHHYRAYDGTCMEVHVWSAKAASGDEAVFRSLLNSIRIDEKGLFDLLMERTRALETPRPR